MIKIQIYFNSEILKVSHFDIIRKGFLKIFPKINLKSSNFEILYRASCDKDKIRTLMDLCYLSKYLLLIIETIKGKIFGAFAYHNENYNPPLGFIFELQTNKILYDNIELIFEQNKNRIMIKNYFFLNDSFFSSKKNRVLRNMNIGETNFTCEEVEVFKFKMKNQ